MTQPGPLDPTARRFGDRATFAVEVGAFSSRDLRTVDLWAAGKWLTVDDNAAFLPAFLPFMRSAAAKVRRRDAQPPPFAGRTAEETYALLMADETEFREQFWFLHWGETVDNVTAYAYLDDDLVIMFGFWRKLHPFPDDLGKVYVARVPPDDFAATLESAADFMSAGYAYVPRERPKLPAEQ